MKNCSITNKKHKKYISFLLCILMFSMCLPFSALADSPDIAISSSGGEWETSTDENGNTILVNNSTGEQMIKAFGYNEQGKLEEVDLEEYVDVFNSEHEKPAADSFSAVPSFGIQPLDLTSSYYDFRETKHSVVNGSAEKVSPDYEGPCTISHAIQTTIFHSFQANVGITDVIKSAIQIGASFTWVTSAQTATQLGSSYSVPSGKIGYIRFTPYMNKTEGNLYWVTVGPTSITELNQGYRYALSPKKLSNGLADGLYQLILK